jgi:hypothetical protein
MACDTARLTCTSPESALYGDGPFGGLLLLLWALPTGSVYSNQCSDCPGLPQACLQCFEKHMSLKSRVSQADLVTFGPELTLWRCSWHCGLHSSCMLEQIWSWHMSLLQRHRQHRVNSFKENNSVGLALGAA